MKKVMIRKSTRPAGLLVRGVVAVALLLVLAVPVFSADGRVEYVEGEVWIERDGQRLVADFGDDLDSTDVVTTGANGTAIISVGERAEIKLREDTSVVVSQADGAGDVELRSGGVFARVTRVAGAAVGARPVFSVRTRTTVAGVRGTQFFVAFGQTVDQDPDVWLCVNEGTVEVAIPSTGQTTMVEEGEGISILGGTRATDPRFYQWTTELNWNFDPESGAVTDRTDLSAAYSDLLDQDYD